MKSEKDFRNLLYACANYTLDTFNNLSIINTDVIMLAVNNSRVNFLSISQEKLMAILTNLYIIHYSHGSQDAKKKAKQRILYVLEDNSEWYQEDDDDQFSLLSMKLKSIIFKFTFKHSGVPIKTISKALSKSLRDFDLKFRTLSTLHKYWSLVDGIDNEYESRDDEFKEAARLLNEEERAQSLSYDPIFEEDEVDEDIVSRLLYSSNLPIDKTGKGVSYDTIKHKIDKLFKRN